MMIPEEGTRKLSEITIPSDRELGVGLRNVLSNAANYVGNMATKANTVVRNTSPVKEIYGATNVLKGLVTGNPNNVPEENQVSAITSNVKDQPKVFPKELLPEDEQYARTKLAPGSILKRNPETGGFYSVDQNGTEMLIRNKQWDDDLASGKLAKESLADIEKRNQIGEDARRRVRLRSLNQEQPQEVQPGQYFKGFRNGRDWQGFDEAGYDEDGWTRAQRAEGRKTVFMGAPPAKTYTRGIDEDVESYKANLLAVMQENAADLARYNADRGYNSEDKTRNLSRVNTNNTNRNALTQTQMEQTGLNTRQKNLLRTQQLLKMYEQATSNEAPDTKVLQRPDGSGGTQDELVMYDSNTGRYVPATTNQTRETPSEATKSRMLKMKGNKKYEAEYIQRFGSLPY